MSTPSRIEGIGILLELAAALPSALLVGPLGTRCTRASSSVGRCLELGCDLFRGGLPRTDPSEGRSHPDGAVSVSVLSLSILPEAFP